MENNPKTPWWRDSVLYFTRISGWVAVPVIISVFVGHALDKKFGTAPWVFIILTMFAFMISVFGLVKESGKYLKKVVREKEKDTHEHSGTTN